LAAVWENYGLEPGIKSSSVSRHPNRLKVLVEEAGSGAYSGNVADAALFGDLTFETST
jgi:hypothetical protein